MIKVLSSGFYTSVQDNGRLDYQNYGVPISGTMDKHSANKANALVNNSINDAVLEITLSGPKLQFCCDTMISLVGADMSPQLNNKAILMNSTIPITTGDILSFGKLQYGCRCYLAVKGGVQTEQIMKSRSMYKGITSSFRIEKDDELKISANETSFKSAHASIKMDSDHFKTQDIDVYKGPEFDFLTITEQNQLLSSPFTIAKENSRMAYQLKELVPNNLTQIITSLVLPGTVQLTPSGKLIVLMRDCQTTGGYPRVLQLSEKAINRLAQKFTNDTIGFKLINQTI